MARPRASRCPHCNAPFTPQTAKTHYVCGYCGHAFDLDGPLPVQTGPRAPPPAQANQTVLMMLAGVAVMVLMGVMGAVFFLAGAPEAPAPIRTPPPAAVRPVAPPVIPAPPPEPPKP
ncbi:hypothetical protein FH620_32955, partial [Corallococcus exiguus]